MGNARSEPPRILCLVGFMGAGKTTVGQILARRSGWSFVDLDERIAEVAGLSIAEIFATEGEAAFRELEARIGAEILSESEVVLATGGGWGAVPDRLTELRSEVMTVWLEVEPEVAVRRAERQALGRPLLDGAEDPVLFATSLLSSREPHYRTAELHIKTTGREADEIASEILKHARLSDTRPS